MIPNETSPLNNGNYSSTDSVSATLIDSTALPYPVEYLHYSNNTNFSNNTNYTCNTEYTNYTNNSIYANYYSLMPCVPNNGS